MAVSDYSTTPGDNTSLGGQTVSDATQVNAVDDLIRQLMADMKTLAGDVTSIPDASGAQDVSGDWTVSGSFRVDDNVSLTFGDGSDFTMQFDTTDMIFQLTGSDDLRILNSSGQTLARFFESGSAFLDFQSSNKLRTTNTGVQVTGDVDADSFSGDGVKAAISSGDADNATTVPSTDAVINHVDAEIDTALSGVTVVASALITTSGGVPSFAINQGFNPSITDDGAGRYTVSFATPEADTNYMVFAQADVIQSWHQEKTVNGFVLRARNSAASDVDPDSFSILVTRVVT